MGLSSPWHWLIVIVLLVLLFGGRGRISSVMGDFANGIKAFRKGMSDENKVENKSGMVDVTPARDQEKSQG